MNKNHTPEVIMKTIIPNKYPKRGLFARKLEWNEMADRDIIANVPIEEFPNNSISTSKYNLLTFLPKNLIEQFSKMANVYFLVTLFIHINSIPYYYFS